MENLIKETINKLKEVDVNINDIIAPIDASKKEFDILFDLSQRIDAAINTLEKMYNPDKYHIKPTN